jgi:integrase
MNDQGAHQAAQQSAREPTRDDRVIVPEIGAVYLRGNTWYLDYWHHGKQYRESAHTPDQRKALKLLRQRHDEIARDEFIKPTATKVTMSHLFDLVVADYERKDNRSRHTLAHRLKPLRTFFGERRAIEITEYTLAKYRSERLADECSKTTINRELAVIRRAYKLATKGKDKLVSPNSVPAIEMYPENNVREGVVEYGDFLALVKHLPSPIDDLCWFAYLMGWRRAQVLSLRWSDINHEARTVIRRAEFDKTKEPSVLAMSESVRAVIQRRWQARLVMTDKEPKVCDLVFHRDGQPIREFRGAWENACIAAGLCAPVKDANGRPKLDARGEEIQRPAVRFHDFRRSCVRNLENAGTPRKVAKSITGHITDSVYERYHIVKQEDQRTALARVEASFLLSQHKLPRFQHSANNTNSGNDGGNES